MRAHMIYVHAHRMHTVYFVIMHNPGPALLPPWLALYICESIVTMLVQCTCMHAEQKYLINNNIIVLGKQQ